MDKRYLIFTYHTYYPSGGLQDKIESFDTLDEVEKYLKNEKESGDLTADYIDVYDRIKGIEIDFNIDDLNFKNC